MPIAIPEDWILRKEVYFYRELDLFWDCMTVWNDFKIFGLPHGRGSMDEKPVILRIIRSFENWNNVIRNWEKEQNGK